MSQKSVEQILGRLLTDDELRARFLASPRVALSELTGQGLELTRVEHDALSRLDASALSAAAHRLDPRITRATS